MGVAIAQALAALDWRIAIGARRTERLDEVAARIRDSGGDVFAHTLDVTDPCSVDTFFDAIEERLGPVDVAVNNAGLCIPGLLHEVSPESLQTEIATNLLGPMYVARRCIPSMTKRGRGDLVFISSDNARAPRTFQAGYSASKTGVEALARVLAMELEGTGVRVSTIRMGPVATEFGQDWDGETIERVLASWKRFGLQRGLTFMQPESIGAAVVAAVTAPPGTTIAKIELQPDGPAAAGAVRES
jgi:NAD(P)-dependent dehydrogenase (short-subunit alcohol dehydrogenase family)